MSKPPSQFNRKELTDAVEEKKALPDLVLKRIIFEAQEEMYNAETKLMYNRLRNNGFDNPNDLYKLRVCILKLFRLISQMAKEGGYMCLPEGQDTMYKKDDWELINNDLAFGRDFSPRMLIRFSGYLTYALHALNLTNLLISGEAGMRSEDTY